MEIPRHWRLKAQRYRLEGLTCQHCGQFVFPPRPVCPNASRHHLTGADRGLGPFVLPASMDNTDVNLRLPSTTFEVEDILKT
jgi:hypothetical protein